ncbi:MAG: NERD domain-containing protein [Gammaproteobacteria bacterium]|nr:NERD domain-containing protein [Gammaproteobacteria bacterium]
MTRYYPDSIDKEHNSEVKFFNQLKHYASNENWVILHSLGLSRPTGEIDFVILIPNEGIICIEVKGGRVFSENGQWFGIDKNGIKHVKPKSPFMQSRTNMFNLLHDVTVHFGKEHILSRSTWHYMVCFTDIDCPPVTPEFNRLEVIDVKDMLNDMTKTIIESLREQRKKLNKQKEYFSPSISDINNLLKYIRPNFDRIPSKSASISFTEEKIISLTEEQYDGLDLLELNDRCLMEGAAGTGKTVLAIEYAKRMAKKNYSVLFICYNNLLGSWLNTQLSTYSNITVNNFHKVFRDLIIEGAYKDNYIAEESENNNDFYVKRFCEYTLNTIIETEIQYDILIIDEVQDLCITPYFDVFDILLRNGLKDGKWALFGDFNRQSLYAHIEDDPKNLIRQYSDNTHFTQQRLKVNCRNTLKIAETTAYLSGFEKPPAKAQISSDLPVEFITWESLHEELDKLSHVLKKLAKDNILQNQIVILSPKKISNSIVSKLSTEFKINEITKNNFLKPQSAVGFSSIYSFKGMESPVVIITDLDETEVANYDSLLYTGMSRAKSLLIVMLSNETYSTLQPRIIAAIKENLK